MKWSCLIGTLCILTLHCSSIVSAPSPQSKPAAVANAALTYWQAFALMPPLTAEQEMLLEEWDTAPLDAKAKELVAASRASLTYLHRAARLKHCDWGLDYSDGPTLMLPHLARARTLARLAALNARYQFEHGNSKAANQNSVDMMVLARHVGSDSILVCILVRYGIEGMTAQLVAPYLPSQNVSYDQAMAVFQSLPAGATVAEAVATEKRFMAGWIIEKMKVAEQMRQGSWRKLWKDVLVTPDMPDTLKQVEEFEQAIKLLEDLLPVYDELVDVVSLPPKEFDQEYATFTEKARATSPAADLLLPSMDKVLATERRNRARLAMLLAASAVMESGPSRLQDIHDPFGEGPFEYRALDEGFELKSKLLYDRQPVTIKVGRRQTD